MFLFSGSKDQDVVNVDHHNVTQELSEDWLEDWWCIDNQIFIVA